MVDSSPHITDKLARNMFSLRCLILFIALAAPSVFAKKKVVCYMAAWSAGRVGNGRFTVLDADTDHCTHVVYAFMTLNENTSQIMSVDPYIDTSKNGLGENSLVRLNQLKLTNPDVKVMASIGGYGQGSTRFSNVARDPTKRLIFINSVLHFLKEYELDGIDMCWQFPTQRGGLKEDKENSLTLFREMKDAFKKENYILSIHMLGKRYVMDSYKIKEVSDVVDFINLMAVEYNGPWDRRTGIMAPLLSKDENNVQFSVDYMIRKGALRNKLILGMPTYGHAYLLNEAPSNPDELLGQYTEKKFASPWTIEEGIISFVEFCLEVNRTSDWIQLWDDASQTPIAYRGNKFVSLDNETSLLKKAELVSSRSLGGVAFWSLDMDDFRGLCRGTPYPMLSTVVDYVSKLPDEPEPKKPEEKQEESPENKDSYTVIMDDNNLESASDDPLEFGNIRPTLNTGTTPRIVKHVIETNDSPESNHISAASQIYLSTTIVHLALVVLAVSYLSDL